MAPTLHKSGYVAIVGRPNAGKSTLLNAILGQKLAIVSPKPQTTRNRILGVLHRENAQVVFLDTPGMHEPRGLLHEKMVEQAIRAMTEVDVVLLVLDAARSTDPERDPDLVERIRKAKAPVILVPNKVDLVEKPALLPMIAAWHQALRPAAIVPISAMRGEGVEALLAEIIGRLPEGPAWFPSDQVSDLPERFLAAELIREQLFLALQQELPYQIAVEVEEWQERAERRAIRILARIWVARDGQKAIVIGRGGEMLKRVGTRARLEMEAMLGTRVHLDLTVGVEPDWTRRASLVSRFGHFGEGGAS